MLLYSGDNFSVVITINDLIGPAFFKLTWYGEYLGVLDV